MIFQSRAAPRAGRPPARPSGRPHSPPSLRSRPAFGNGHIGVSTNGSLHYLFFDRGTFWVLPLTCFYLPRVARAYLFPQPVKIHYFCSGPMSVDPTCPRPNPAGPDSPTGSPARPPGRTSTSTRSRARHRRGGGKLGNFGPCGCAVFWFVQTGVRTFCSCVSYIVFDQSASDLECSASIRTSYYSVMPYRLCDIITLSLLKLQVLLMQQISETGLLCASAATPQGSTVALPPLRIGVAKADTKVGKGQMGSLQISMFFDRGTIRYPR